MPDPDWPSDGLSAAKNTKLKALDRPRRSPVPLYLRYGRQRGDVVSLKAVKDGEPGTKYPGYIDGERRAPPEDCGGGPGFEAFLEAIADPRHPEHKDATQWHQGCCSKAFDPEVINELDAKLSIGAIAKPRAAGKAS